MRYLGTTSKRLIWMRGLVWALALAMLGPPSILAQTRGTPAKLQVGTFPCAGGIQGAATRVPAPSGTARPAEQIRQPTPALVEELRQAVTQGDLEKAKTLIDLMGRQAGAKATSTSEAVAQPEEEMPEGQAKEEVTPPGEPKLATSPIESLFRAFGAGAIPEVRLTLCQFGYDVFEQQRGFAPLQTGLVGSDYLLGPGDEFTVTLWGLVDGNYPVRVSRKGTVLFPKIGEVPVTGIAYRGLKSYLEGVFRRHFKRFNLSVTMGQLRGIQVFIVGEVQKPGSYTLSSLSTAFTALFAAGGPTKGGTLRDIKVLRGGKVLKQIDLYKFLLHGDKSQDMRLQDQDTVFVPLIGPVIGIAGQVQRPAIYELKGPATLGQALALAGGIEPTGYLTRVQIERTVSHDRRVAIDLNLTEKHGSGLRVLVQNMDLVKVAPIPSHLQRVVYLKGHVVRPGPYELKPGMRISDVVKGPEELLPEAFLDYARIVRYTGPEQDRQIVPFNLRKVLFAEQGENPEDLELQSLDEIEVYSKEDLRAFPSVSVVGEVRKPGTYPLLKETRVSDLIIVAGGLTKLAYQKKAELTRYEVAGDKTTMRTVTVDLERAVARDPRHNLKLEEFDALAVRPNPGAEVGRSVTVLGEVKLPGQYWVKRGERLSSVLKRAGGFTTNAFPPGIVLIRESVRQKQEAEIQRFITAERQRLTAESAGVVAGRAEVGALGVVKTSVTGSEQQVLALRLQQLEAIASRADLGRVVMQMDSLEQFEGSEDDLKLEPNDKITIPQLPQTVSIIGSVKNPSNVVHRVGLSLEDYLEQAGGPTEDAHMKQVYVLRANGATESAYARLKEMQPGDTIVVPQKIEAKTPKLALWQSVTSIIGSIALTAAGIAVIGR